MTPEIPPTVCPKSPPDTQAKLSTVYNDLHTELDPVLTPHIRIDPEGHHYLHHPLVVMWPIIPGAANRQLATKMQQLRHTPRRLAIWIYERPYRLPQLLHWLDQGQLTVAEAASILPAVWIDYEDDDTMDNPLTHRVIAAFRQCGYLNDQEQPFPNAPLTVYRGGAPNGIAWSTSLQTAQWFAHRFPDPQPEPVYQATAPPAAVLAQFNNRNEHEVVCDPSQLRKVQRH